jgi:hypothetical protein
LISFIIIKMFSETVKVRRGMVEAILLPYFEIIDIVRFAGLSKTCRSYIDPNSPKHINYGNLFAILFPDEQDISMAKCKDIK